MENSDQKTNILNIIRIFLNYWPILLISCAIFIAVGVFYMLVASKTYMVYARIAINTEKVISNKNSNEYVNVDALMNQDKNFGSEIIYLSSTPLIKEVIIDMNLFTTYYNKIDKIPKELKFSLINMYKSSPFLVVVDETSLQPLNTLFYLNILNEEQFSLNAYEPHAYLYNSEKGQTSNYESFFSIYGTYKFGQIISNGHCSFKIILGSNYNAEQYQGKDLFFKFNSPDELAYAFQQNLKINPTSFGASTADLTFEGNNLDMSLDFLSKLIQKYMNKSLEKKNRDANNTIEYIDSQLANISGSLGHSEKQLQNFRASQDVMDIGRKTTNIYDEKLNLERTRDEIQTRYQNLTLLNNYFEENKESSTFIVPSFIGMSDATLKTLIEELTSLSTEKQNLISTNQVLNPRIKTLDANIKNIIKVLVDNISFNLASARNELNDVNAKIRNLEREISRLPQTQSRLVGLEREFKINDAVYTSLMDKRIQAQIVKASNIPDCEIIEPVRYVEVASPSVKLIILIALFLGLFFPSVYIVFVNFLTKKIKTQEELDRFSTLPYIGSIPHNDNSKSIIVTNFPQSLILEKFHSLRSNLVYYLLGERHKSILLTSTLPNEGKSFSSLNLALSFASTGYKTILLAFDLRKSSIIFNDLNKNSNEGLSSYLINQANLEDIVIKTEIPNFYFIHNGQIPPDPVTLLSTKKTKTLFDQLKSEYDYIIIDTPPFGLVTDPFLLMQYADIKIYISRLGTTTKKALKLSMKEIQMKKIENIFHAYNDDTRINKKYTENYSNAYIKKERNIFKRLFRRKR